jgi:hypothetical protein
MALRYSKGPAKDGSIGFTLNRSTIIPSIPIVRQITENKWWMGLQYLSLNYEEDEVVICATSDYSGWKYILARTIDPTIFLKRTYMGNNLVLEEEMIV